MTDVRVLRCVGVFLAVLSLAVLAGCPPEGPQPGEPVQTPAGTAAATRPVEPLPAQALLKLEDLKPQIGTPTTQPSSLGVSERARAMVADASRMIEMKDYNGAVAQLEKAIGYEPGNPRVRRLLGIAYAGLNDRGRAEENLRKAVEGAGDDLESHLLLADFYLFEKKTDQAQLSLRRALKCTGADANEPKAAETLLKLGEVLEKGGCWTAASECYTRLAQWMDQEGTRYAERPALKQLLLRPEQLMARRGVLLMQLRRPADAKPLLAGAYERDKADTTLATMLIRCMLELKEYSQVEAELGKMAGDPQLRRVLPGLAEEAARASNNPALPLRVWRAVPKKAQADSLLAISLAQASQRLGNNDGAVEVLQSVFQSMPENVAMARELAELSAKVGKPEQGFAILTKTLAANESAEPAVLQGLRRLVRSLPAGLEEQLAKKPPADPNEAFAWHYAVGRLAQLRYNATLASAQFQKSIDARPDFRAAREAMLDILLLQGKVPAAREQFAAIQKSVEPWFADYLRGKIELAAGDVNAASDALDKSVAANDRFVPSLELLADALHRKGQTFEALRKLDAAFRAASDKIEVYRRRFPLLLEARQYRQAEAELDSLRREAPDNLDLGVMIAELQLLRGRDDATQREKASQTIAELARRFPDSPEVMVLSLRNELGPVSGVLSRSDLERATKKLDETLKRDPRSVTARKFLAEVNLLAARYADALAVAQALRKDEPRDPEIGRLAARTAILARQYKAAEDILEGMLQYAPGDPWAQLALLTILERDRKFDRAIQLAEGWLKQVDLEDQKAVYRLRLLRLYEEAKANDKALKLLDDWIKSASATMKPSLQEDRLRTLVRMDKVDDAVKAAGEMAKVPPANVIRPRLILAAALQQARKTDKALELLDGWIGQRSDANVQPYVYAKMVTCLDANRIEQVRALANDWMKTAPMDIDPRRVLIAALIKLEKYDEATKLVEGWLAKAEAARTAATAPASGPSTRPAAQEAADLADWCQDQVLLLLIRREKYADALKLIDPRLAKDANAPELFGLKGTCLQEMGKRKESVDAAEQAWKLMPFDPGRLNNLGYGLADLGIDLDRAETMIRRALAVQRELHVIDSLGWVLYKKGQFREAARLFEDGLVAEMDKPPRLEDEEEDRPVSCVIFDHAGDTFWRLGWSEKAVEYWKAALESAGKEKARSLEVKEVLSKAPQKIQAAQSNKKPPVAPLGEGIKE